jgi:hypothetical protein
MPTDISLLTCGRPTTDADGSDLDKILTHIQAMIDAMMEQLSWLAEQEDTRVAVFGPFLGRSLLELSTTALIGRLDPLRVLLVHQVQAQPNYTIEIPWKASIRWQGDVLAGKPVANLWGEALEYEKITKALLGDYYDHLVWRPAAERMATAVPVGGNWLAELAGIDPSAFVARRRQEIGLLYSSLSKGIHHEFVMPPRVGLYDRNTVKNLLLRTVRVIADLALVSHFITHASFSLASTEAVDTFNRIENFEVMK